MLKDSSPLDRRSCLAGDWLNGREYRWPLAPPRPRLAQDLLSVRSGNRIWLRNLQGIVHSHRWGGRVAASEVR
jgi:hypothetical protein